MKKLGEKEKRKLFYIFFRNKVRNGMQILTRSLRLSTDIKQAGATAVTN